MTTRITVSLSDGIAERLKARAGSNASAYVERALRQQLLADGMAEYRRLRGDHPADDLLLAAEEDAA